MEADLRKEFSTPIWLDRVNYYRGLANLPEVTEDPTLSAGDNDAAQYMVMNNTITHNEVAGNPGYSDAGKTAAAKSDLAVYYTALPPQTQMVDEWMTGAFHGPNIIDPQMQTIGFGTFQNLSAPGYKSATALNVESGIPLNATGGFPVKWPGDGHIVSLTSYSMYGTEKPDARTSCAGYANTDAGLPISLQLGSNYGITTPNPTSSGYDPTQSSLTLNGSPVSFCEIDGFNYTNTVQTDFDWQTWGQNVLKGQGTIVLLPQHTLAPGPYAVRITVSGTSYTWTFTIDSPPALPTVSAISQTSGLVSGGTILTISGTGFTNAYAVYFGAVSVPATNFTVDNDNQITVTSSPPATASGVVDIMVANPGGISAASSADQFTYLGTLQFCCLDTAGGFWYAGYPASGGSWPLSFSQLSAQKSTDSTPLQFTEVAGAMAGTDLHIFGIDNTSGALWHTIYATSGSLSFDQVSAQSSGGKAYQKVSCASTPSGSVHICVIDASGIAYHDVHTATQGNWQLSFGDNINLLCGGGTYATFNDIACTAIGEVLHIVAGGSIPPAGFTAPVPVTFAYTNNSASQGSTFTLSPYVDIYRSILNYTGPGIVIEPIERGFGFTAMGGVLHVYAITTGGQSAFHIEHTASSDGGSTWQAPDSFTRDIPSGNTDLSCTNWGGNVHVGYGFPWVPGVAGVSQTMQTLEHTIYSSTGWSSGFDTVLSQVKEGNYFSKVSLVGG